MSFSEILRNQVSTSQDGNVYHLDMDCDIVVMSDLHIDVKKKRPQYFWETMKYLDNIADQLQQLTNPVFISLGDLFDKDLNGAKGIVYFEEALKRFKRIEKITNGRCFMVYGNHEDTYLDTTPSGLIMHASNHLVEIMAGNERETSRTFGDILKTPHTIRIGSTKVSLFHFRKYDKAYTTVQGDSKFHIGLFHDTFLNNTMRGKVQGSLPVDLIWKNHMMDLDLKDIDLAVFGDFHIPIPPFRVNNRRDTAVIIPGSLGRNNFKTETHDSVKLPIIKLRRDKEPEVHITTFPLIPYTLSYNMADKVRGTQDISAKIRALVGGMRESQREEISLRKFSSFVYEAYGEEWGSKVYNYIEKLEEE